MFFKKVILFIVNLFHKSEDLAEKYVFPAVKIVDSLINSPFTGVLENIIPGDLDKMIIDKAREVLPKVVQSLSIASQCQGLSDPNQIIDCFLQHFGQYDADGQKAIKHSLAALLSNHLSDNKITWSDAVHLAEAAWMTLNGKLDLSVDLATGITAQSDKPGDPGQSADSHQPAEIAKDESQASS